MGRRGAGWLGAALLLCAQQAGAEPAAARTSALSWSRLPGAESCVASRDLARAVERRLDRPVFVPPSHADLTVEGRVESSSPGFRAVIHLVDTNGVVLGTRELETASASCGELAAPLALAIALMIDPDARPSASVPPRATAPPAPAPRDVGRDDATPMPAQVATAPWRFQVAAGPIVGTGFLPEIAGGVQLRAMLDPRGFPGVELSGAYWPDTMLSGNNIHFSLAYGGLALCPLTADVRVMRLSSCAGMAVGAIHTSSGITDVVVHPFLDARAGRKIVGPLLATAGVGVAVPLQRRIFYYNPRFQMASVAGTLDVGLGVEVP